MTGARFRELIGTQPADLAERAACRGATDPDLWHSVIGADQLAAKAICKTCPVRVLCADWAVGSGQIHGIWGGYSEAERAALARGQDVSAARRPVQHRQYGITCAWCGIDFIGKAERKYCGHSCAATHAAWLRRLVVA